jgi:hypothetical protein
MMMEKSLEALDTDLALPDMFVSINPRRDVPF